jgi:hypothetical protein
MTYMAYMNPQAWLAARETNPERMREHQLPFSYSQPIKKKSIISGAMEPPHFA